jgi:hypothetical protein
VSGNNLHPNNEGVVPANAGTHNHRASLEREPVVTWVVVTNDGWGVWVPAFAGTTAVFCAAFGHDGHVTLAANAVIASEAKQSRVGELSTGLLRRLRLLAMTR